MTKKQMINEAIKCMNEVSKSLAMQGNLWEVYKCDSPGTKAAAERRKKIEEAIKYLETL